MHGSLVWFYGLGVCFVTLGSTLCFGFTRGVVSFFSGGGCLVCDVVLIVGLPFLVLYSFVLVVCNFLHLFSLRVDVSNG